MNKKLLLFCVVTTASLLTARAASEQKINQQFDTHAGGKLIVDVDFGTIDITGVNDDKVTIEGFRRMDFRDDAAEKQYLAEVPLTIAADGKTVVIRARAPKQNRHQQLHYARMDARYSIRVPKRFAAQVSTGGGGVTAGDITGDVRAESGGGDLTFARTEGAISAHSGGGLIKLERCTGRVEVDTGGGDIVLANGNGTLHAQTGGGAITLRDHIGDADVQTGGGDLRLQKIDGTVAAETGGGSINASITSAPLKKIRLASAGGNIELTLPKAAAADINAEASDGRVSTDLPLAISAREHDRLRGTLNGGGAAVVLRTSGGNISIAADSQETASR